MLIWSLSFGTEQNLQQQQQKTSLTLSVAYDTHHKMNSKVAQTQKKQTEISKLTYIVR